MHTTRGSQTDCSAFENQRFLHGILENKVLQQTNQDGLEFKQGERLSNADSGTIVEGPKSERITRFIGQIIPPIRVELIDCRPPDFGVQMESSGCNVNGGAFRDDDAIKDDIFGHFSPIYNALDSSVDTLLL